MWNGPRFCRLFRFPESPGLGKGGGWCGNFRKLRQARLLVEITRADRRQDPLFPVVDFGCSRIETGKLQNWRHREGGSGHACDGSTEPQPALHDASCGIQHFPLLDTKFDSTGPLDPRFVGTHTCPRGRGKAVDIQGSRLIPLQLFQPALSFVTLRMMSLIYGLRTFSNTRNFPGQESLYHSHLSTRTSFPGISSQNPSPLLNTCTSPTFLRIMDRFGGRSRKIPRRIGSWG